MFFLNVFRKVTSALSAKFQPFRRVYEKIKPYLSPGEVIQAYRLHREAKEVAKFRPFLEKLPEDVPVPRSLMARTPLRLRERYQYTFSTTVTYQNGETAENVIKSIISSEQLTKTEAVDLLWERVSDSAYGSDPTVTSLSADLIAVKKTIF